MLLRAQILYCTRTLAGVAATSRQQKYSEVASVLSALGLSRALPTAGPHWSTAVTPLSVVTQVSSLMHTAQVGQHTHHVLHPLLHGQPEGSEQRESHTAHSSTHQKLYVGGFGPSATEILLCRFYSLVSQHTGPVTLWTEPWVLIQGEEMHNRLEEC